MELKLNDIIYQERYLEGARFCNKNNFILFELDRDDKGRRWQIIDKLPQTEQEILEELRYRREKECFVVINRGKLWYDTLTEQQVYELDIWYKAWLDITLTRVIPSRPTWLK